MRVRTAIALAVTVTAAAGALVPAQAAAKKKPLSGTYKVTLTPAPVEHPLDESACESDLREEGATVATKAIKVTGPGKLVVKVTGYIGDWDTSVASSNGSLLAAGSGSSTPDQMSTSATPIPESLVYKSKKAQTLKLRVCNFAGGPEATVNYTYTYS